MTTRLIDRDEYEELGGIFIEIEESGIELSDTETGFIADMRGRYERYGVKLLISDAQIDWLRNIGKRARGE